MKISACQLGLQRDEDFSMSIRTKRFQHAVQVTEHTKARKIDRFLNENIIVIHV